LFPQKYQDPFPINNDESLINTLCTTFLRMYIHSSFKKSKEKHTHLKKTRIGMQIPEPQVLNQKHNK
jgi:hypothetical protein